jgi:hypothetical protein
MSSTPPQLGLERPQTRAKNANQHPGLLVKKKRRTQAEMKAAREQAMLEAEAAKQEKEKKLQDIAKLENAIAEKDRKDAEGVADKVTRALPSVAKPKKDMPKARQEKTTVSVNDL